MYVSVNIDPEDIIDELDDHQLKRLGLRRVSSEAAPDPDAHDSAATRDVNWASLGEAIRRRDFERATQLLNAIADKHGYSLPPIALASAA